MLWMDGHRRRLELKAEVNVNHLFFWLCFFFFGKTVTFEHELLYFNVFVGPTLMLL